MCCLQRASIPVIYGMVSLQSPLVDSVRNFIGESHHWNYTMLSSIFVGCSVVCRILRSLNMLCGSTVVSRAVVCSIVVGCTSDCIPCCDCTIFKCTLVLSCTLVCHVFLGVSTVGVSTVVQCTSVCSFVVVFSYTLVCSIVLSITTLVYTVVCSTFSCSVQCTVVCCASGLGCAFVDNISAMQSIMCTRVSSLRVEALPSISGGAVHCSLHAVLLCLACYL